MGEEQVAQETEDGPGGAHAQGEGGEEEAGPRARAAVDDAGDRSPMFGLQEQDVAVVARGDEPVLQDALRRGLDIRIGLEDVVVDVDGLPTAGNAELVTAARALLPR